MTWLPNSRFRALPRSTAHLSLAVLIGALIALPGLSQAQTGVEADLAELQQRLTAAEAEAAELRVELNRSRAEAKMLAGKLAGAAETKAGTANEIDVLSQQLAEARAARAALEAQLNTAMAQTKMLSGNIEGAAEDLTGTSAELAGLREQLAAAEAARATLESQLNQAQAQDKMLRGALITAQEALQAELERSAANTARLEGERDAVAAQLQAAEDRLTELRGAAGVSAEAAAEPAAATPAEAADATAEAEAAEAAEAFLTAARSGSQQTRAQAESRLHAAQTRLAEALQAQEVYRTQPRDSLTGIARRFYGDGNLWMRIYRANQHVIENPDRLLPGVSLIIP